MADVSMPHPGVWLVTCPTHGYIGSAIHLARDRADELADQHNRTHHLEEERTTMTTNPLPDLSKWHEVPADADIPANVRYAFIDEEGDWITGLRVNTGRKAFCRGPGVRYFTADPIPTPRPTPPTERGTVLVDVTDQCGTLISRLHYAPTSTCDPCPWLRLGTPGAAGSWFRTSDLVSWTVADVVPRTPDPLDENDHRDRHMDDRLTRRNCGAWHYYCEGDGVECPFPNDIVSHVPDLCLAGWAKQGRVRFATEADQS